MTIRESALTILLLSGCLVVVGCSAQTNTRTPVVVVFETEGEHGAGTISAYSTASGSRCIVRQQGLFSTLLIGYDAASNTWLLDTSAWPDAALGCVGKLHDGKMSTLRLADFPQDAVVQDLARTGGLMLSSVQGGFLILSTYDLCGSLKSRRVLGMPHRTITDCIGQVSVTRAGVVAASLLMGDTKRSELCIFDAQGHLKERIGRGTDPLYAPDGRHLAYNDYTVNRTDSLGAQTVEGNEGTIIIYDSVTRARNEIAARTPPGKGWLGVLGGVVLDEYRWSPDGQRLVCSYVQGQYAEQSLYAVDVSGSAPKWEKLPVEVYAGRWTVMDKMPPAACKP